MDIRKLELRQHKRVDQKSPHKAVLFLLAMQAYRHNKEQYLDFENYIHPKLCVLLRLLGIDSPKPEYPFWRMQNDEIWEVKLNGKVNENISGDVRKQQLFDAAAKGGLITALYAQAKNLTQDEYVQILSQVIENNIDSDTKTKNILRNYFLSL